MRRTRPNPRWPMPDMDRYAGWPSDGVEDALIHLVRARGAILSRDNLRAEKELATAIHMLDWVVNMRKRWESGEFELEPPEAPPSSPEDPVWAPPPRIHQGAIAALEVAAKAAGSGNMDKANELITSAVTLLEPAAMEIGGNAANKAHELLSGSDPRETIAAAQQFLQKLLKLKQEKGPRGRPKKNPAKPGCMLVSLSEDNIEELERATDRDPYEVIGEAEDLFAEALIRLAQHELLYEACLTPEGEVLGASAVGLYSAAPDEGDPLQRPRHSFSIAVAEHARRRGIARMLVQSILEAHPRAEILVEGKVVNPFMEKLLGSMGFVHEEEPGEEWSNLDRSMGRRMYLPNPSPDERLRLLEREASVDPSLRDKFYRELDRYGGRRVVPIGWLGPSGRKQYGVRRGGVVQIANHIGYGGLEWPIGKWARVTRTSLSASILAKVPGDDREWQVTSIYAWDWPVPEWARAAPEARRRRARKRRGP